MSAGLQYSARVSDREVDLTLAVAPGETVALLGPNGAGKSTVLSVIAGLLRPDGGRVLLDERPLVDTDARTWVPPHDRRVALLAQDPLLFPHLSALDNVAFGPRSRGVGRRTAREQAAEWLSEVGVADLGERRPHQVSGGQAQRIAVARALAADPQLLLLDEPMAALDVAVTPELRRTLRRVLTDRTALIVTHDALDALLLADRVVVIDGGRVVEEGAAAQVLTQPRSSFAARIAGLDMLTGTWQDGAVVTATGDRIHGMSPGREPALGDPAVAVFNAQAVSVFTAAPGGSPRNALAADVIDLEPLGDRIRVRATAAGASLSADVTPMAAAELDLAPGSRVIFSIKATEVTVYGL